MKGYSGTSVFLVILIPVLGWWAVAEHKQLLSWVSIAVLMLLFIAVTGLAIVKRPAGILIDDRNVISLSRFQMTGWTVILLSAYVSAALFNIYAGVDDPLAVGVPKELWLAMGISTTSLVGSPLLLAQKKTKTASMTALNNTLSLLQSAGQPLNSEKIEGQILGNDKPSLAQWSDMFTGDETSNGAHIDLSKLQMFFFTLAIILSYVFALWQTFRYAQPDGISQFPALDDSTVALLGISHSGYLASKAVPRS